MSVLFEIDRWNAERSKKSRRHAASVRNDMSLWCAVKATTVVSVTHFHRQCNGIAWPGCLMPTRHEQRMMVRCCEMQSAIVE